MIQPYLHGVDSYGETALLFLDGRFSHAIRKGPMLSGPDAEVTGLYRPENISRRQPSPAELAVAEKALAAVPGRTQGPAGTDGPRRARTVGRTEAPGGTELLYARVDLLPGPDGYPVLVELELAEPSLFLGYAPGAADRLADAIATRLSVGRS